MAKILMKGNEAIAEAAVRAGCRFFFGYPITPQTEIPEYMSARMPELGGCYLQAESEVAAINMVYGAAGTGVRVMTSSSSPGVSLKQEALYLRASSALRHCERHARRAARRIVPASDISRPPWAVDYGDYHCVVRPASYRDRRPDGQGLRHCG